MAPATQVLRQPHNIEKYDVQKHSHTASESVRDTAALAPKPNALLAIRRELDFVLIGMTLAASIIRARGLDRPLAAPFTASAYIPAESPWTSNSALVFGEFGISPETVVQLRHFYVALEQGRIETSLLEYTAAENPQRDLRHAWLDLSAQWCDIATLGREAFETVTQTAHLEDDTTYARMRALRALLVDVEQGGSPGLDDEGYVRFPGWADRRQASRVQLEQEAVLHVSGRSYAIMIHDISQHGLGLGECEGLLRPGVAASVTLAPQRLLSGVAVWARGERAGLRFKVPLSATDPLLA